MDISPCRRTCAGGFSAGCHGPARYAAVPAFLLLLTLAVILFTACGGTGSDRDGTGSDARTDQTRQDATGDETRETSDNEVRETTETEIRETAENEMRTEQVTEMPDDGRDEAETGMSVDDRVDAMRALIDRADGEMTVRVFGTVPDVDASAALTQLEGQIDALEKKGIMVSFMIADTDGRFGVSYNCDKKWTSQSTIKAPYLTSVLMQDASVFRKERSLIKAVITVSDNDAYETLRVRYGNKPFAAFCRTSGVSTRHSTDLYPRQITVRDMCKLWTTMYGFLNTREDMETYISYFSGTAMSCVYRALGDRYAVQTKAGWESGTDYDGPGGTPDPRFTDGDPLNDEIATNDTGIVYANDNPYLIAVFTSAQSDPDSLIPLICAIDGLHSALVAE